MKARLALALPALLAVVLGTGGCRSDRTLSADEVRKLFSGKTVRGYQEADGGAFRFTRYFAPDGTAQSQERELNKPRFADHRNPEGAAIAGKWWVRPDGALCLRWQEAAADQCGQVVTDFIGQYRQVRPQPDGTRLLTMTFLEIEKEKQRKQP